MGWISKLLNKPEDSLEPSHSTGFLDMDFEPVPINLAYSDPRAARALLINAAMQVVQMYGLPAKWLSFEVVTLADDEKAFFQLQVLINHWDEYLMAHTHAFERALMKRILTDNKKVGNALRAVLWRVAPIAGCPYDDMPEADAWSERAVQQRGMVRDQINRELYKLHQRGLAATAYALSSQGDESASAPAGRARVPEQARQGPASGQFESTMAIDLNDYASTLALSSEELPHPPPAQPPRKR